MMDEDQMTRALSGENGLHEISTHHTGEEQSTVQENACSDTGYVDAANSLSDLYETLKQPIPEKPSAKYITDTAHKLVDSLNDKRKHDTQLIEEYRQAMDVQTQKLVQALEQHLCQVYGDQNAQVDSKLQELFTCLNRIATSQADLDNFKESLRNSTRK